MNKEEIMKLLQAMYLDLSGLTKGEMIKEYEVEETFARAGIKLNSHLKKIKLQEVKNERSF